jgi:hypothetical protein
VQVGTADRFAQAVDLLAANDIEAIASYTAFADLTAAQSGIHTKGIGR